MNARSVLAIGLIASASSAVLAQMSYNCTDRNGTPYKSERGCASITAYGPVPERQTATHIPRMGEAQEHLQYLGAHCSSLSEGIRTGPARGVRNEVTAELQRNYQRECGEQEREARAKLNAQRNDAANAKKTSQQMAIQDQRQAQIKQQQCDESKRIIFNKKKRTDLSAGEQQELQKFIQNFKERCE